MKRFSLAIFFALLFCSILSAQSVEFITPTIVDHGKVSKGDIIKGEIEFLNSGDKTLELESIKASCGCTAVEPSKMTYEPGEKARIPFTVETKNFSGVIRKNIKLNFVNAEPKTQMVVVQANVITDLAINPKFVNFRQVNMNADTTVTEYFEIENTSDADISITGMSATNTELQIFPSETVIPAGKSHLIRLEFIPAKVGRHNTRITIKTDHTLQNELTLPVYINVQNQS